MNIHCFQHVEFEGPGCIEDWITRNGHQLGYTRFYKNDTLPDIDSVDLLIVMGAPMSFDDDDKYSWLTDERNFIKKALQKQKAILGICLGAQIIADAIDGSARHGHAKEIGWFPVTFHKEKDKTGLDFIPEQLTVFHWHGDTFEIPKGAVRIASTGEFPNQGFIYKKNVIGLQFHCEMHETSVRSIIENCRHELKKATYVQSEEEILNGLKYAKTNNELMFKIMDFLGSGI